MPKDEKPKSTIQKIRDRKAAEAKKNAKKPKEKPDA